LNHGDTDDTEIVSGDEGDLTSIHDIASGANEDSENQPSVESTEVMSTPAEVADLTAPIANQDLTTEPQASLEANPDRQLPLVEEPTLHVDVAPEGFEPEKVKSQPSGWQRARNFLFGGSADVAARLNHLTQAIEDAPESAVNYILRAEVYMDLREYALAQADFQRAIELAETQFELADWGLMDQVMRDRAITGLEKVQRRL
jgi:hypothetical protein